MEKTIFLILGMVFVLIISGCTSVSDNYDNNKDMEPDRTSNTQQQKTSTVNANPQAAFNAYRDAIANKDIEAFRKNIDSGVLAEMESNLGALTGDTADMIFGIMATFMVDINDVVIENENIVGDTAEWTVSEKGKPGSAGIITFKKESGSWKVVEEKWTSKS